MCLPPLIRVCALKRYINAFQESRGVQCGTTAAKQVFCTEGLTNWEISWSKDTWSLTVLWSEGFQFIHQAKPGHSFCLILEWEILFLFYVTICYHHIHYIIWMTMAEWQQCSVASTFLQCISVLWAASRAKARGQEMVLDGGISPHQSSWKMSTPWLTNVINWRHLWRASNYIMSVIMCFDIDLVKWQHSWQLCVFTQLRCSTSRRMCQPGQGGRVGLVLFVNSRWFSLRGHHFTLLSSSTFNQCSL